MLDSAAASVRKAPARYEATLGAMLASLPIMNGGDSEAWLLSAEIVVDRIAAAAIEGEIAQGAAADALRALRAEFIRNLLSPESIRRLQAAAEAALETAPASLDN